LNYFTETITNNEGYIGIGGAGSERFNAVKISYVQITALLNECRRETSPMERNIGRKQTTEAANAIKSAPVQLTENSMAHIRTSHSANE